MSFPSVAQRNAIRKSVGQVPESVIHEALERFKSLQDLPLTTRLLELEHQSLLGEDVSEEMKKIKIVLAFRSV